jgi:purine-binding chemotaxis protein CheW
MPGVLAGFLNLGGTLIAVLRLSQLFGLPEVVPGLYTPLVILRLPEGPLALLVEKVSKFVSLPEASIVPAQENYSFNECVDGLVAGDKGTLLLLSGERLLLEKERQCLAQLEALEQERLGNWEGTAW